MASSRVNVVSRFLRSRGFARSITSATRVKGFPKVSGGFQVASRDGETVVTYTLGSGVPHMSEERRRELVSATVYAMEKALSQRYTVIMFEPAEGVGYTLTVQ